METIEEASKARENVDGMVIKESPPKIIYQEIKINFLNNRKSMIENFV